MKALCIGSGLLTKGLVCPVLVDSNYEVDLLCLSKESYLSRKEYLLNICGKKTIQKTISIKNKMLIDNCNELSLDKYDVITTAVTYEGVKIINQLLSRKIKASIFVCENDSRCYDMLIKNTANKFYKSVVDRIITQHNEVIYTEEYYYWAIQSAIDKFAFTTKVVDIDLAFIKKFYILNTLHCIIACVGGVYKYNSIHDAVRDTNIYKLSVNVVEEIVNILNAEYAISAEDLHEYAMFCIYRFNNENLNDSVFRVGRNILNKLDGKERIGWHLKLAKKHGISVPNLKYVTRIVPQFAGIQAKNEAQLKVSKFFSYTDEVK